MKKVLLNQQLYKKIVKREIYKNKNLRCDKKYNENIQNKQKTKTSIPHFFLA